MKLSEKGLKKLERHEQIKKLGYVSLIDEIEFESDDFKGVVVLTVEKAKKILQSSCDLLSWADCPCIQEDNALEIQSYLKERIQQVEKDNASN